MTQEPKDLLQHLGFETVLLRLLEISKPTSADESRELLNALIKGLASVVAWEAYFHIEDHEGYNCAKEFVDAVTEDSRETSMSALDRLLEMNGRTSMKYGLEPTNNERVRDEILKEMENE